MGVWELEFGKRGKGQEEMVPRETEGYAITDETLLRKSMVSVRQSHSALKGTCIQTSRPSVPETSRIADGNPDGTATVRTTLSAHATSHLNTASGQEQGYLSAVTYTDTPTQISVLPEGRFLMPEGSNVFLAWTMHRIQIPTTSTPLSIRWVSNGQRFFEMQGTRSVVDDSCYLLLNQGQESASEIDSLNPVRCYTVCFRPGMAEEVLGSLLTPHDRLLDEPGSNNARTITFMDRIYPHDDRVSRVLARLAASTSGYPTYGWFEDQFNALLMEMLTVHRDVLRELDTFPAMRSATRVELYRRLYRAREFMEASLEKPLTLADIAQVAWFSPFHFLRLFKQVFGETPHQYLIRRRLDRAKALLLQSNLPVTEICYAVGFESLGSFSTLFRREVGLPPAQFRKAKRQ